MSDVIRVLVVDDEPLARRSLRLLLEADSEVELVGECADGHEAAEAILRDEPDLVFLDVQMPEMGGFEALEAVGSAWAPVVIFVTAYDEHALRAFEFHALDFLLKPFGDERFRTALERAKREVRRGAMAELGRTVTTLLDERSLPLATGRQSTPWRGTLRRFVLRSGGRVQFLPADEVDWIEAADYYVRLHAGGRSHLVRHTMKELERGLDPRQFVRLHRSVIANVDRIQELHEGFKGGGTAVLRDGTELSISRRRKRFVERSLSRSNP